MSDKHITDEWTEEWIVENKWPCSNCGHMNKGRLHRCENCSARKDQEAEDKEAIPDDLEAARVEDPELLEVFEGGVDWTCEYCDSKERNAEGECSNCGGEKDPLSPPPDVAEVVEKPWNPTSMRGSRWSADKPNVANTLKPSYDKNEMYKRPSFLGFCRKLFTAELYYGGFIAIGVTVLTALLLYFFLPREINATVASISWRYKVELQERQTNNGEGWRSNMPGGSFDTSCHTKLKGHRDCDPYDCNPYMESYQCNSYSCRCRNECTTSTSRNSNGSTSVRRSCRRVCSTCYKTCTRTKYKTCYKRCPVYEDWCTYKYYTWPTIKTGNTTGSTHKVHWADLVPEGPLQRLRKHQWYQVVFEKDGGEDDQRWKFDPKNLGAFKRYTPKDVWKAKVNRAKQIWPLQRLTAEGQ